MKKNVEEDIILNEIVKRCNRYEKIIIKIFRRIFIKCYNIQRINLTNIFLN